MEIIYKKIEELKPYENNPRINAQAIKYVAKSIEEFGFQVPLVIDKDGIIVTGHTRYEASKKLKLKEVPCIIADDLTEKQIKMFRLADNKVSETSTWNYELLEKEMSGIVDINLEDFGFEKIKITTIEEKPEYDVRLKCPNCDYEGDENDFSI